MFSLVEMEREFEMNKEDGEFANMDYTEVNEQLTFEQELLGALARGYCHDKNASKVLDADLIEAMAEEVLAILNTKSNEAI